MRLKRQNVIYGFSIKNFGVRAAKNHANAWFFALSSILGIRNGGGEPRQTKITDFENEDALKHLPLLRFLGDDKLTEVYVVGKATLRRIWKINL